MKRWVIAAGAALGLLVVLGPERASAQFMQPPASFGQMPPNPLGIPQFSPYLNLMRGNNPGINYFGVVQPQLQTQQSLMQLQQQQTLLEQQQQLSLTGLVPVGGLGGAPLPTGHQAQFMNYLHYFPATVAGVGPRR
jgi:hypothetical protein